MQWMNCRFWAGNWASPGKAVPWERLYRSGFPAAIPHLVNLVNRDATSSYSKPTAVPLMNPGAGYSMYFDGHGRSDGTCGKKPTP